MRGSLPFITQLQRDMVKRLFATGVKKPLTCVLQETLLLPSSKKALISP
jgi:hypothetical protein